MAQPKYQPILNEAATPTYIRPGVVDGSAGIMANTIADLIPGAIQGYEGYQLKQVREAQDKNITDLEASWKAEKDIPEAEANIIGGVSQLDNIWGNIDNGSGLDKMDAVNLIEKDIQSQVKRLEAARQQGKLSDAEFLARNTKIVREAINRNPWMEADIYSAANRHLAAMGITTALDEREKIAKSLADNQEQTMKFYRQAYKDANMIHKFNPNAGELAWQQDLAGYNERKAKVDGLKDFLDSSRTMSELQLEQALNGGQALKFHNLEAEDFQTTLVGNLENQQSPQDYDNAIAAAKLQKETRVRQYRQKLGSAALTEKGRAFIAQVEGDYDGIINTLVDAGNGKNGAERLKTRLEVVKAAQGLEVREQYNPEMIDIATKVMTAFGDSIQKQLRDLGLDVMTRSVKNVLNMVDPKNAGNKQLGTAIESGTGTAVVKGILEHDKGWADRDSQLVLTNIVASTNQAIAAGSVNPKMGITAINGTLKSIAQNATKFAGQPVNPEFARQVGVAVDTSMKSTVGNMLTAIKEVMDNPANQGAKDPELDVLPDGSFVIKTGDATADDKFNRYFSALINNALDSYAAANGLSKEKAAAGFYNTYLKNYVAGDPELEMLKGKELKIQSPADAKAALDTGRITRQEYDAILKEGFK